jgi:hypothetical protein
MLKTGIFFHKLNGVIHFLKKIVRIGTLIVD